jgi:hypothetical protein
MNTVLFSPQETFGFLCSLIYVKFLGSLCVIARMQVISQCVCKTNTFTDSQGQWHHADDIARGQCEVEHVEMGLNR